MGAGVLFCLFTFSSFAKVLKDEVYITDTKTFTFKEVCKSMVGKVYPLISKVDSAVLDCMKAKVIATDFCAKELAEDPYLARGKVLENKVECISSSQIIFKYQCEKNDELCKDHEVGCFKIKEKLAHRLQIGHSSITDSNTLNCYFSKAQSSIDSNNL